jgi:hypothetical protein
MRTQLRIIEVLEDTILRSVVIVVLLSVSIVFRLIALEVKLNYLHESLLQHGQLLVLEATLLYLGGEESGLNFVQIAEVLDVEQFLPTSGYTASARAKTGLSSGSRKPMLRFS